MIGPGRRPAGHGPEGSAEAESEGGSDGAAESSGEAGTSDDEGTTAPDGDAPGGEGDATAGDGDGASQARGGGGGPIAMARRLAPNTSGPTRSWFVATAIVKPESGT